jgi:FAD-dependent urate hydroxylase
MSKSTECEVTIVGAGPYGLAAAAHLRGAGVEFRAFGDPMLFWEKRMPKGMFLRSSWDASHIADPQHRLTLDSYCHEANIPRTKPIPLRHFVEYGKWFQRRAVSDLDRRTIERIDGCNGGFRVTVSGGESYISRRVVVATGIGLFTNRPKEFEGIPASLASHSSDHDNLDRFAKQSVVVVGSGQSALESAALLAEAGAEVEVIARQDHLNWVGLHPRLHHLGPVSKIFYSKRDVGPAGISRLVAAPHLFRRFPRWFQDPVAYRAIRPAVAGWLQPRIQGLSVTFGQRIVSVSANDSRLRLKLHDGSERLVDHALLSTGFRVNMSRYSLLAPALLERLETANGFPVLRKGMESSIPGLHFIGKTAAWSFGPILGFVSGAEFAGRELTHCVRSRKGK